MQKFGVEVFEPMGCGDGSIDLLTHLHVDREVIQYKYDGTHALAHKTSPTGRIVMPGRSWKTNFAENPLYADIVKELRDIPVDEFILDSELTFFNAAGKDMMLTANATIPEARKLGLTPRLMVFDLISVLGKSARNLPLYQRVEALQMMLPKDLKHVRLVESHQDYRRFKEIFDEITVRGGEGVVMKPHQAPYIDGDEKLNRKVKNFITEDCVIIGITRGEGSRAGGFGSLILAQWVAGELQYVGRAGTGLNGAEIARLKKKIETIPEEKYDFLSVKDVARTVKPVMVAEVKYLNRTMTGLLRMPVYVREREDKTADMCKVKV